jgi:hypothetical protein
MYILEVAEYSKYLKKPNNYNKHDNNVENVFDLNIHWDIIIDKPQ